MYKESPFVAKDIFRDVAANMLDVNTIRKSLEGPIPIRFISAIVGLALMVSAGIGMFNIFMIGNPTLYVLQIYELFFGLAIVIIELKDQKFARKYKAFIYKWFPFTTVMAGKGLLLITAGMLGLGFGISNIFLAIPGICSVLIGCVYCVMHFGKVERMNQMYDVSMFQFNNNHV